jgi:DNA-binding NarL/FixJ family response regulator
MLSVRIALLSDDRLFSDGLLRILASETPVVVVDYDKETPPHIVIVDSRLSGALGVCEKVTRDSGAAVIMVAGPDHAEWSRDALRAGARGILSTSARAEDMVQAVRVVSDGLIWAPRRVLVGWIDHLTSAKKPDVQLLDHLLSIREREVFRFAASGLANKELAERLAISEATVKVHLTHIFQKLGVRGRAELAAAYHGVMRS